VDQLDLLARVLCIRRHEFLAQFEDTLYNLVCGYALCAAIANGRPFDEMSQDDRSLFDRYTALATSTLQQAVSLGYTNLTQIDTDPDPSRDPRRHQI
jgi:hypothetical protein